MAGNIQTRPDRLKPYKARYWGPDGHQHSKAFRLKGDAERWLRRELDKMDRELWADPSAGEVTFSEWVETWFAGLSIKPATAASYRSLLNSRILPVFAETRLKAITPAAIRSWIAEMVGEGLSASRIRQARQVVNAALAQAVDDGIIGRNPTGGVKAPTARPRRQRFLTAEQVAMLAAAAEDRRDGAGTLVQFLSFSGLRWGEAVALRVSAVDVLRRRVTVRESATLVGAELVWGTPKNHRTRAVMIPAFVARRMGVHMAGLDRDELVFTSPKGLPLRTPNFQRRVWLPAVASCGLSDLVVHDLRNSAASLMVSAGASIKAVQRALGHSSAALTLDRYSHLYDDDLEALADALEERFAHTDVAQMWPKPPRELVDLASRTARSQAG